MKRLAVVAVCALAVLAGCTGPAVTDQPATNTSDTATGTTTGDATTTDATTTDDGYYHAYRFRATETSPEGIARDVARPMDRLYTEERQVADGLFTDGAASTVVMNHADGVPDDPGPLDDGEYLRHDGAYYRVDATVTKRVEGRGYQFSLEGPMGPDFHDNYERAKREAVAFEELSAADRHLFAHDVPPASDRENAVVSSGFYYLFPAGDDPANSRFLDGEVHYVRYDGDLFRVQYDGERTPVVRQRIQYDLVRVADSASAFADARLDEWVTPLDGAGDRERRVLRNVFRNGTVEWEGTTDTTPQKYRATATWINDHGPGNGVYVRYDGTLYHVTVREVIE